jgi:phosphohistidine phosphatase SixA
MARITFLRHGNAEKVDGQPDISRKLSDKGRQQAQERRAKLGDPEFDLVLVSPAPQTTFFIERPRHSK